MSSKTVSSREVFSKILIANRGEIACRVIKTTHKLGIKTVAVYSDADAAALHVLMADEAVHIGGSAPAESYLDMQKVLDAAIKTGAQAVHPGYGFLSENAAFSHQCAENNIVFIGPPAGAIEVMGSKSAAKQSMEKAGVPLLPGYHGDDQDETLLKKAADDMGYPVLLKAVAGGGGKGMRQVHAAGEFDEALSAAKREAKSSFGNDDMLVEKFLQEPRHVEVQVFCDTHGNGVYLFERDCSVQRRHQKIIEEAPAPGISDALRAEMGEAALRAAHAVSYVGAGTVEFLLDTTGEFYFMEMNTRLQVEHPVTEMITGQDLVEWQLVVAEGKTLPLEQSQLNINGHSLEARIYAEDPDNDFLPAAGKLNWLQQPTETMHVRVDTGVVQLDEVGVFYDPMIAKLIVWDESRERALQRLSQALASYRITGVTTNIAFLRKLASNQAFKDEQLSTDFIERHSDALFDDTHLPIELLAPLASLYILLQPCSTTHPITDRTSPWHADDNWRLNAPRIHPLTISALGEIWEIKAEQIADREFAMSFGDFTCSVSGVLSESGSGNEIHATIDGHRQTAVVIPGGAGYSIFTDMATTDFELIGPDLGIEEIHDDGTGFKAPMNGTVVEILVNAGDKVNAGDTIIIMEAMKMEHAIKAPVDGRVTDVFFAKGDLVDGGSDLLGFEPEEADYE